MAQSLLPSRKGYLFRSSKNPDDPYNGYAFHLKELQKVNGTSDWTIHDLRRTFATLHAELGTPIHVIEKMLNHQSGSLSGVAGIYNRYSYMSEMREAVGKYEQLITSITQ
jgi:integrase